jgi:hypothetical protein
MTAASSGTPLILSVLALVLALVSTVGSIAAMLMARANVQWQTAVAARETWMREFREQVAALLASQDALGQHSDNTGPEVPQRNAEIKHARRSAYHRIRLLFAKGRTVEDEAFIHILDPFMRDEDTRALVNSAEHVLTSSMRAMSLDFGVWSTLGMCLGLFGAGARAPVAAMVAVCGLVPFDSADEALASNEFATNWLRNNVLEFTKGMPEVMAGNASKTSDGPGRWSVARRFRESAQAVLTRRRSR